MESRTKRDGAVCAAVIIFDFNEDKTIVDKLINNTNDDTHSYPF